MPSKAFGFAKSKYCLYKFRRTALAGDWLVMRSLLIIKLSTKFHVLRATQTHESSVRALINHSTHYSMATVISQPYNKRPAYMKLSAIRHSLLSFVLYPSTFSLSTPVSLTEQSIFQHFLSTERFKF